MPFNGSGSFSTKYNWQNDAALGLNISSSRMQGQDQDMADGLSLCLTKDGQQTPTANIPMGNFRITNLGTPVNPNDAVNKSYVDASSWTAGPTTSRPGVAAIGQPFFDTTLGQPVWALSISPITWVNAAGVQV